MVINGRVRQACSALVDQLLEDHAGEIELRPMTKFPVIRDLIVDRSRLFQALRRVKAWVPVDGYFDMGPGRDVPRQQQEQAYPLSKCMSCGCCLEACPQYTKIEVAAAGGRKRDGTCRPASARPMPMPSSAPTPSARRCCSTPTPPADMEAAERLDALTAPGGIQVCGNAQNCVAVCPKEIPLTTSIARAGRATTLHAIKKWFDG